MPDQEGSNRGRRTGRSRVAADGRRGRRARGAGETGRVRGASKGALSPQAAVAEALLELLEQCGDALGFDVGRNWPTDLGPVDLVWFHDLGILVPQLGRIPALERRLPVVAFEIEGGGTSPKRVNAASLRLAGLSPALGVVVLGPDSGDDEPTRALQEAARGWLHRLGAHSLAVWTFEDVRALAALVVEKLRAVRRRAERGAAGGEAGRAEKLVALAGGVGAGGRRGRRAAAGAVTGRARPARPLPDTAAVDAIVARADINKSEKIRRLTDLGVPRTRIAELLGIKYQFVYNVEKRYREQGAAGGGRKRRTRRARAPAGTKRASRGRRRVAPAAAAGVVKSGKRRRGRPAKRRRPRIKAPAAGVPGAAGAEGGGQPKPGAPAVGEGAAR